MFISALVVILSTYSPLGGPCPRDCYNVIRKTEVTENFSCPFCLMQCATFKGLRFHLCSSHDLFNFEFWVTEDYQTVNVSVKIDILRSECKTSTLFKMKNVPVYSSWSCLEKHEAVCSCRNDSSFTLTEFR